MRLLLSFAVTLSLLAGQTCGGGIGVFHPLRTDDGGESMSRAAMRCNADVAEGVGDRSSDCGPGQCLEGGKDEREDVAVSPAYPEASYPASPTLVSESYAIRVAFSEARNIPIDKRHVSSVVKIE